MREPAATSCLDEETLLALAQGQLDEPRSPIARAHVDGCEACRDLLAHTVLSLRREPAPAHTIGRYQVDVLLGAGAMGVVYRARDPLLGRDVALKLLRSAEAGDDRLLREAEAMARLSHPNVVAVYDAGRFDERVFLAMELVDGETLAAWLTTPRPPEAILARFAAAGAGLAAAHAAGLVHRDFKPHNVLCGKDGRMRVADFGLARATALAPEGHAADMVTGVAGTPAYMAPEQLRGEPVTPQTDQFAFCVALYEALYGARPFSGDTLEALRTEVASRRIDVPPRRGVPASVRRALGRGLAFEASARFPSMEPLIAALQPRTTRIGLALAALLVIGLAAAGTIQRVERARREARCTSMAAEIGAVWNAEARTRLEQAFARIGLDYAARAAHDAAQRLDGYTQAWAEARAASCRAAASGATKTLDDARDCLTERRDELGSLVGVLARADAATVEQAAALVAGLAPIDECRDPRRIGARHAAPPPPAQRDEVTSTSRALTDAVVRLRAGRPAEARAALDAIWPQVRHLAYLPLEAEAHWLEGRLSADGGGAARAISELEEAASAAEAGRADELVARARIALVEVLGTASQDRDRALAQARYARVPIERLGDLDRLEGDRQLAIAHVERAAGRAELALIAFSEAEQRRMRAFGEAHPSVAELLSDRAGLLEAMGRHEEASRDAERAVALTDRALGGEDASLIRLLGQLGVLQATEGRYPVAVATYERALSIARATVGEDAPRCSTIRAELGLALSRLGRFDEAEASLRRALAISTAAAGPEHPDTGAIHDHLGVVLLERGEPARALAEHEAALDSFARGLPPMHPRTGRALHHLAAAQLALGHPQAALDSAERARSIIEQAYGREARDLAVCLTLAGEAELALEQPARAIAPLERGLALRLARHASPRSLTESRFALARALWDGGGDRARARILLREAQDAAAAAPRLRPQLEAWLRAHP